MIKIIINSHIDGSIALNHLIKSMRKYKESYQFEIIVFIGGYFDLPNFDIYINDNITFIKCNHNSIDFTGLIALYELYKFPEYFEYFKNIK
jgi:hypothetical protein